MVSRTRRQRVLCTLVLVAFISACGRAEHALEQPKPIATAPLGDVAPEAQSGLEAYPLGEAAQVAEVAPAAPTFDPEPFLLMGTTVVVWPTDTPPPPPQQTQTASTFQTEITLGKQIRNATATVEAYTPTPEPIITPVPSKLLLRDVWPAPPKDTPPVTELLLVRPGTWEDVDPSVWRVQLPNGQQRLLTAQPLNSRFLGATLSADQHQLAYLARLGDSHGSLYLNDLATQQEIRFWGFPVSRHSQCTTELAWSPNGRLLAFSTYTTGQLELHVYSGGAPKESKLILQQPRYLRLLGWLDAERLLVGMFQLVEGQNHVRIVAVNWRTGAQQELANIPGGLTECVRLSPDRSRLLFYNIRDYGDHVWRVLELATSQFSVAGPTRSQYMVWSADSTSMLVGTSENGYSMELRRLDQPNAASQQLVLGPPMRSSAELKLLDASPDGRWLLACTDPGSTLLYEVAAGRWTELGEGCSQSLGWWPRREE